MWSKFQSRITTLVERLDQDEDEEDEEEQPQDSFRSHLPSSESKPTSAVAVAAVGHSHRTPEPLNVLHTTTSPHPTHRPEVVRPPTAHPSTPVRVTPFRAAEGWDDEGGNDPTTQDSNDADTTAPPRKGLSSFTGHTPPARHIEPSILKGSLQPHSLDQTFAERAFADSAPQRRSTSTPRSSAGVREERLPATIAIRSVVECQEKLYEMQEALSSLREEGIHALSDHQQNLAHVTERILHRVQAEQGSIQALEQEVQTLRQSLVAERSASAVSLKKLQHEKEMLETKTQRLEQFQKDRDNAHVPVVAASASVDGEVGSTTELQELLQEKQRELEVLREENTALRHAQDVSNADREAAEAKHNAALEAAEQLRQEVEARAHESEQLALIRGREDGQKEALAHSSAERKQLRAEMDAEKKALLDQLNSAEITLAQVKREVFEREEKIERLQKEATSSQAVQRELAHLRSQLKETKDHSSTAQQQYEKHMAAATKLNNTMKQQMEDYEEQLGKVEEVLTEALGKAGVEIPEKVTNMDLLVQFVSSEFLQLSEMTDNAEMVQSEWERTYQKAKDVNQSLQQQLNDAWRTVGELRESLSLKEEAASQLGAQLSEGQRRCDHLQGQLSLLTNQLETFESRRLLDEVEEQEGQRHVQEVAALQTEVENLHELLRVREEELSMAHASVDNLQHALDSFKSSRERDVAAQTAQLQSEVDAMRKRLEQQHAVEKQHQEAMQQLKVAHEAQLAAKYQELTSLHIKLAELRKHRGGEANGIATAPTGGGESMQDLVDKQLLAQVFANFIHAFVEQRRETPEILKVLCGLLNWDEAMQEKVGLLPGPSNPQLPSGTGAVPVLQPAAKFGGRINLGGRLSGLKQRFSVARSTTANPSRAAEGPTSSSAGGRQGSLGALWVEFLLKESERNGAADPVGATAPGAVGGGSEAEDNDTLRGATPLRHVSAAGGRGGHSTPTSPRGESPMPRPLPPVPGRA